MVFTRRKVCKKCSFTGRVNMDELCGDCAKKGDDKCGVCNQVAKKNAKALVCDLCEKWIHAQCVNIRDRLYEEMEREKEFPWVCTKCLTQAKKNREAIKKGYDERERLMKDQQKLEQDIKGLRESLGAVERENRSLREKNRELEKSQIAEGSKVAAETAEDGVEASETAVEARTLGTDPAVHREDIKITGSNKEGRGKGSDPQARQDPEVAGVAAPQLAEAKEGTEGSGKAVPNPSMDTPTGKARWPIVCVGDSMIKNIRRHMVMKGEKSQLVSLSGKGIEEVTEVARRSMSGLEEGMLILQGGGNGLRQLGPEQTVKKIIECVEEIKVRKKVRVAVVGILGRPKESRGYEELRRETNRLLQQEVAKMKMEYCKHEGDYGVSFMNMDEVLPPDVYGRDGVHLNREGDRLMCKRFLEWVTATERLCRIREGKRE